MPKYCLGAPLLETRQMSPEESSLLEARVSRARSLLTLTRALAWAAPTIMILALVGLPGDAGAVIVVTMTLAIAPLYLWARDAKRRYKILKSSAAATDVEVYERRREPEEPDDEPDVLQFMRIPTTGLILEWPPLNRHQLLVADAEETASIPACDEDRSLFPPSYHSMGAEPPAARRMLSEDEKKELAKVARTRAVPLSGWGIAGVAYCLCGVIAMLVRSTPSNIVRGLVLGGFAVAALWGAHSRYRLYRLFDKDIEDGYVVEVEGDGSLVEVAPNSGYLWTIGGEPAPDRTIGVSAKTY